MGAGSGAFYSETSMTSFEASAEAQRTDVRVLQRAWSSTNRETEFTIPITKTTTLGRKVKAVNPYDTYWKFGDLMEDNEYYQGVLCDLSDFGDVLVDYEAS